MTSFHAAEWCQRTAARFRLGQSKPGTWATLAALVFAPLLSLWPVLSQPGWPFNHESWVWATRVGVLRAAWHHGEWMPLWWKEGNDGLGSPMPALYHKLQNIVCALLLELFGDIKLAQILSLLLFSILGCVGIRSLALRLGASPCIATLHALLLPFTSYVAADWLIRGAFAEHAAFMILPWLLVGLLDLIEQGLVRVDLLVCTLLALFYAHSITALYSVGLICIAALIALARHPGKRRQILAKGALAAACFLLAIAPMVWVMRILAQSFYLDHTITGYYEVHQHLTSLVNALFVGQAPVITFSAAPDPELWVAIAIAAVLAAWRRWRADGARSWADPALAFVLLGFALMTFLRLTVAGPVYDAVPGLRYIQFPWRLLSFLTVLLIALSAALFGRIQPRLATPLACAVLVVLAARSRVFHLEEVRIPSDELAAGLDPTRYVKWWEYVPTVPGPASDEQLSAWAQGPAALSDTCQVQTEGCPLCFLAECSAPGTIALPYAFSGLELVTDGAGRNLPVFREETDARVLVEVGEGRTRLRYRKPSWASVGRLLLSKRSGRSWWPSATTR